jgi:hypothetical protein
MGTQCLGVRVKMGCGTRCQRPAPPALPRVRRGIGETVRQQLISNSLLRRFGRWRSEIESENPVVERGHVVPEIAARTISRGA